jgi:hypothetical protein
MINPPEKDLEQLSSQSHHSARDHTKNYLAESEPQIFQTILEVLEALNQVLAPPHPHFD